MTGPAWLPEESPCHHVRRVLSSTGITCATGWADSVSAALRLWLLLVSSWEVKPVPPQLMSGTGVGWTGHGLVVLC